MEELSYKEIETEVVVEGRWLTFNKIKYSSSVDPTSIYE